MALSRVQATAKVEGFASTITLPNLTPTLGNGIVVLVSLWGNTAPTSCQDNRGNNYQLAKYQGGNGGVAVFYCSHLLVATSPVTITVTLPSGNYYLACAVEVAPGAAGYYLKVDQTAGATGSSGTAATGSTAALTGPDVFLAAVLNTTTSQAAITVESVTPSWTQEYEQLSTANTAGEADTRALTSVTGATTSASWTLNAGSNWTAAVVAFLASNAPLSGVVTQDVVEVISQPTPAARVSQDIVESASLPVPAARVTQDVVEILGANPNTAASTRVTQLAAETLGVGVPATRVTQLAAETVGSGAPAARVTQLVAETVGITVANAAFARVTQDTVELVSQPTPAAVVTQDVIEQLRTNVPPVPYVTQDVIETLTLPPLPTRITQLAIEVFYPVHAPLHTTQVVLELLYPFRVPARATQQVVEFYNAAHARTRATQVIVEIFRDNPPCSTGQFPVDDAGQGGSCRATPLP